MRWMYVLPACIVLFATAAACGKQPAAAAVSSPCPGMAALATAPVTATINPVPTSVPGAPGGGTYTSFALQVPQAAELLVVVVEAYPTSKESLVPSFMGPDGQILTRGQLARDDITGGNPGDFGFTELMHIQSPKTGTWTLRLSNTTGRQLTVTVRATALFHLHLPPLVTIDAQPTSGHVPLTVTFDASSTKLDSATATYCWDFGDGIEWGSKVTHTFRTQGVYNVALTVTDSQGRQGFAGAQVTVTS